MRCKPAIIAQTVNLPCSWWASPLHVPGRKPWQGGGRAGCCTVARQNVQREVRIQHLQALPQLPGLPGGHTRIVLLMQAMQAGVFRYGHGLLRQAAAQGKQAGAHVCMLHHGLYRHAGRLPLGDKRRARKVKPGSRLPMLHQLAQGGHGCGLTRLFGLCDFCGQSQYCHSPLREGLAQALRQFSPARMGGVSWQQQKQLLRLWRPRRDLIAGGIGASGFF